MNDNAILSSISAIKNELVSMGWSAGETRIINGYAVLAGKGRDLVLATGETLLAAWSSILCQIRVLDVSPSR
jgi:hypothetical protein